MGEVMRAISIRYGAYGLALGFMLSRMGFSDFAEVHRMFLFTDLRLFLTFAVGVGLAMVGFFALARGADLPKRFVHRGSIPGGVLFGAGWAITGACPAILLVQIGEGQLAGMVTLAGAALGMLVYPALQRRFFRWDSGTCA
jgi:uncharacterized protein